MKIQVIFSIFILTAGTIISAEELTAVYTSKLPHAAYLQSAIYDGADSIYLFGGYNGGSPIYSIYRYSLSNSTISTVGGLQSGGFGGTLQSDSEGNIFHVGRYNIEKFNVLTYQTTTVVNLTQPMDSSSSVKYNGSQMLIIGGNSNCNKILAFDMETYIIRQVGTLPLQFCEATASAIKTEVFLFGNIHPLVKMNLQTLESEIMELPNYPSFYSTSSVTDGVRYIYIGLGFLNGSGGATRGIYQLDTETLQTKFIPVRNLLEENEYFAQPITNVYVEKEHRIYFFGGRIGFANKPGSKFIDDIWYFDLSTLGNTLAPTTEISSTTPTTETTMDPDIFSCENRTDGSYTHPLDCAKFIICRDEEMETFECPPPLLFDPLLGTCHWPDDVDCGLTCVDKPDGPYPHPHDCALFIDCHGGKLDVFKCPEPLLFDLVFKVCRYADLVDCDGG